MIHRHIYKQTKHTPHWEKRETERDEHSKRTFRVKSEERNALSNGSGRFTYVEEMGIKSVSCKTNRSRGKRVDGLTSLLPWMEPAWSSSSCIQEGRTHGRKQHAEGLKKRVSTVAVAASLHCFNRMCVQVCATLCMWVFKCVRVWMPVCVCVLETVKVCVSVFMATRL